MNGLCGRTILVVDDARYITTTLSLKLRQGGASVMTSHDGREAFALARLHRPDLICTGLDMPLMGGIELARALRAEITTQHIPLLVLTARGHRLEMSNLINTNVRGVLAKPFSAREVLAKLEEIVFEAGAAA